jgi:hypothetical protein
MAEGQWLGEGVTVLALLLAPLACGNSDEGGGNSVGASGAGAGSGGSGAGTPGTGGNVGGSAPGAGTGGSAGAGSENAAGNGGLLSPGQACRAPATKCKGRCITADAPVDGCTLLAEGTFDQLQLVGDTLYLRDYDEVKKLPKAGGAAEVVFTADTAAYFRVEGDHVYYAWEFGGGNPAPVGGYVGRAPLAGGAATILVDELEQVRGLRLVGDALFLADCPTVGGGGVYKTGPVDESSIDTDATQVAASPGPVCDLESDGDFVYAGIQTAERIGEIVKIPAGGGDPTVLYTGEEEEGFNLFRQGSFIYWVSYSTGLHSFEPPGKLGRIELATGMSTVLATTDGYSRKLTSDGSFAYVASSTVLWRVPVAGGELERVLTTDNQQLGPYVLDGDSFIIALTGEGDRLAGLVRTSIEPELLAAP